MNSAIAKKLLQITRYPYYLRQLLWRFVLPILVKHKGVNVGKRVRFYGMPIVSMSINSKIHIGDSTKLCSISEMTPLGVNHPVVLRTIKPGAQLIIGCNCGISGGSICAEMSVEIGSRCLIGANVTIADTDFHTMNPVGRYDDRNLQDVSASPIVIEDDVFIGTGSTILKGVRIGRNSVIGANSVVTKNIPPDSIAAGNPARVLKKLSVMKVDMQLQT